MTLTSISEKLSTLQGWKRYGLASLSGAGVTLAMAPYYFLPFLIVGYGVLILLIRPIHGDTSIHQTRRAFFTGWAFGFGYFLSGLYWMAFAFLVRAEDYGWMLPIAMPTFSAFLGLFMAVPAMVFHMMMRRNHSGLRNFPKLLLWAFIFATIFSISEYLRGHILTGLPWNLTAQALAVTPALIQSASLYGVYGLGFITLLLIALPTISLILTLDTKADRQLNGLMRWGLALCVGGFVVLGALGFLRLTLAPTTYNEGVSVKVVQPNIRQKDKMDPAKTSENFAKLMSMARTPQSDAPTYMIWPENAVSWIDEQPYIQEIIGQQVSPETIILTGTIRRQPDAASQTIHYFNSLAILPNVTDNSTRHISAFYDKHHLVPFGEYLPFFGILETLGLSQLAPVQGGYTPGTGPASLNIGPAPFAPLICYETIFPGAMFPKNERPLWLVTVTNDAWFGDGAGPKQHLDQAKLRAVENGLPMVRSANTGISAIIDANGRLLHQVPLYEDGVIEAPLPNPVRTTPYVILGDSIYFLMIFFGGLGFFFGTQRQR